MKYSSAILCWDILYSEFTGHFFTIWVKADHTAILFAPLPNYAFLFLREYIASALLYSQSFPLGKSFGRNKRPGQIYPEKEMKYQELFQPSADSAFYYNEKPVGRYPTGFQVLETSEACLKSHL